MDSSLSITNIPNPSLLSNIIKQESILEGIRMKCRESDDAIHKPSKLVTALMGIKAIAAGT
jgi:hypothetical protein